MNAEWKAFLTEKGAEFNAQNEVTTYGNAELERYLIKNGPVIANLSHQALIKVSGEEAFDFLQGQFSNELKDVSDTQAQLSSYCDPQGKVLAIFTIFKQDDAFYLSFNGSLKDAILKRLTMFKLRAKVDLEDVSDSMIHVGYAGDFADLDVQRLLSTKIKDIYEVDKLSFEEADQIIAMKVPGPYHRYSFFGPLEQMKTVWTTLKNNGEATGQQDWNLLNVVSGQPEINAVTSGEFIAQFLNLDKLEAINFKKGCYPGQEIIARMHYRGRASKRMMRLHIEEAMTTQIGEEFILFDQSDKKYKFTCISRAPDIYDGTVCLAVSTVKALESVDGDLKTEQGAKATIEPMPYDLADES